MLEGLLTTPFLERLNLWFVAAWAVLALYWLTRVGLAARQRQRPAVSWWSIPGLLLLLLAPLLEVPVLFGLGAAVLLLAEWWPRAFVPVWQRTAWGWGLVPIALGGAALLAQPVTFLSLCGGLALALWGLAHLLGGLLWLPPRPPSGWLPASSLGKVESPTFGTAVRWQPRHRPDPPELSVALGPGYLTLRNESGQTVQLRGWTPAHRNAFLALDRALAPRAEHRLRRDPAQQGVRVWYTADGSRDVRVLHADWQEPTPERTLN
ncbi:hypothetical protein GCM10017783_10020 [Deinococcus piscis]|uniref:Uncharacterized protein n=1 Tax=Deinococcus piscis TaxID=394230 RepID=A0ABQ3K5C2_9DEIO|nr:hypothetical protein [Deinococcus piscis]GHF99954.1 hypothetical protein GCM10017783_10020 [Deinococcus piscis]